MKKQSYEWTESTKSLIKELHAELSINNNDWHRLKNSSDRRAAELLISAISQISEGGDKEYVISLTKQALKWINNEVKDPGCPSH